MSCKFSFIRKDGLKWPYKFEEAVCRVVTQKLFSEKFTIKAFRFNDYSIKVFVADSNLDDADLNLNRLKVKLKYLILDLYFEPYYPILLSHYPDPEDENEELWDDFKAIMSSNLFGMDEDSPTHKLEVDLPLNMVTLPGKKIKPIGFEVVVSLGSI